MARSMNVRVNMKKRAMRPALRRREAMLKKNGVVINKWRIS